MLKWIKVYINIAVTKIVTTVVSTSAQNASCIAALKSNTKSRKQELSQAWITSCSSHRSISFLSCAHQNLKHCAATVFIRVIPATAQFPQLGRLCSLCCLMYKSVPNSSDSLIYLRIHRYLIESKLQWVCERSRRTASTNIDSIDHHFMIDYCTEMLCCAGNTAMHHSAIEVIKLPSRCLEVKHQCFQSCAMLPLSTVLSFPPPGCGSVPD